MENPNNLSDNFHYRSSYYIEELTNEAVMATSQTSPTNGAQPVNGGLPPSNLTPISAPSENLIDQLLFADKRNPRALLCYHVWLDCLYDPNVTINQIRDQLKELFPAHQIQAAKSIRADQLFIVGHQQPGQPVVPAGSCFLLILKSFKYHVEPQFMDSILKHRIHMCRVDYCVVRRYISMGLTMVLTEAFPFLINFGTKWLFRAGYGRDGRLQVANTFMIVAPQTETADNPSGEKQSEPATYPKFVASSKNGSKNSINLLGQQKKTQVAPKANVNLNGNQQKVQQKVFPPKPIVQVVSNKQQVNTKPPVIIKQPIVNKQPVASKQPLVINQPSVANNQPMNPQEKPKNGSRIAASLNGVGPHSQQQPVNVKPVTFANKTNVKEVKPANHLGTPYKDLNDDEFEAIVRQTANMHLDRNDHVGEHLEKLLPLGNAVVRIDNLPAKLTIHTFNLLMGTFSIKSDHVVAVDQVPRKSGESLMNLRIVLPSDNLDIHRMTSKNKFKTVHNSELLIKRTDLKELEKFLASNHSKVRRLDAGDNLTVQSIGYSIQSKTSIGSTLNLISKSFQLPYRNEIRCWKHVGINSNQT